MAAPAYASGSDGNAGNTFNVTAPSGMAAGDTIVISVACYAWGGTPAVSASGFTVLPIVGTGTVPYVQSMWKVATSGDVTAGLFAVTNANSNGGQTDYVCSRFTGAHATAPVDVSSSATGTGATATIPSITTTGADRLLVVSHFGNGSGFSAYFTGFTENNAAFAGESMGTKAQAASGATGTFSGTHGNEYWGLTIIALVPAATGGGAVAMAATSGGVCTATATRLPVLRPFVATAAGLSTAVATRLPVARPIAGTSPGTSTAVATALALIGAGALAGTSAGLSTTTAAVQTTIVMAGTAPGTSATTANLTVLKALSATGTGTSTAVASTLNTGSATEVWYLANQADGASTEFSQTLAGQRPIEVLNNKYSSNNYGGPIGGASPPPSNKAQGFSTLPVPIDLTGDVQVDYDNDATLLTGAVNGGAALYFVDSTTGNGYGLLVTNSWHIYRFNAGVQTEMSNVDRSYLGVRTQHTTFIHTHSTGRFQVFTDGRQVVDVNDTSTFFGPGLLLYLADIGAPPGPNATVDNIRVSNVITGAPNPAAMASIDAGGVSTATGTLGVLKALVGSSVPGTSTTTAAVTVQVRMIGTAASVSSAAASSLIRAVGLIATAPGVSTTTANFITALVIAATAPGTSTATAVAGVLKALTATAPGTSTAVLTGLSSVVGLSGTAGGTSATSGNIPTAGGGPVALAGTAASSSTTSANLSVATGLAGTAATTSTAAAATFAVTRGLGGTAGSLSTTTANLIVTKGLVGTATGLSTTTAVMVTQIKLTATTTGVASTSANMGAPTTFLDGTATGVSTTTATLLVLRALSGTSTALSTVDDGTLLILKGLSGTAGGLSNATAVGRTAVSLAASVPGGSSVVGTVSTQVRFNGASIGLSTANAVFSTLLGRKFIWSGSAWVEHVGGDPPILVWNGTRWAADAKVWDGIKWQDLNPT